MGALPLRPATPEDADAIAALVQAAYAKWVPIIGRKPRPMEADYQHAVRENVFALLEEEGRLVALIELSPAADHLLIVNVAVSEAAQGRGIGSALLAHAEDEARKRGLPEMRLYTNALMAANRALYERRGYTTYLEEPFPGGTAIHMRKALA